MLRRPLQVEGGKAVVYLTRRRHAKEPEYEVGCYKTGSSWVFPCSDSKSGKINEAVLQNDWLSGNSGSTGGTEKHPAHLSVTYADETHSQTNLMNLYSLTLAFGFTLTDSHYHLDWLSVAVGIMDLGPCQRHGNACPFAAEFAGRGYELPTDNHAYRIIQSCEPGGC